MKYCCDCGDKVSLRIPEGDNMPRFVCDSCGVVHYQNPKIVAGCIARYENRILLCKRAIEPRRNLWTLPAGFMENGETTLQAAARESMEEANASIDNIQLFGVFNIAHINQVYMMFQGNLVGGEASPGPESLETGLYLEAEIPWAELAFPVVRETIKLYYEDIIKGQFGIHFGDLQRVDDGNVAFVRYC